MSDQSAGFVARGGAGPLGPGPRAQHERAQRARGMVARLTPEEKASLLSGRDDWHTVDIERVGLPSLTISEGSAGLAFADSPLTVTTPGGDLGVRRQTRATAFPSPAALGCSFDPDVAALVARAIGEEAREQSVGLVMAPGVNTKRAPLAGSNDQNLSEDPMLSAQLGEAWVRGVQSSGVGACLPALAAATQATRRMTVNAVIDEQTFHEVYLRAFERIVRSSAPWAVMCADNRVNGSYCSEDQSLLTGLLRQGWGYDGLVVSGRGGVLDRVRALSAGTDLAMPPDRDRDVTAIAAAMAQGRLEPQERDDACVRVVETALKAAEGADSTLARRVSAHHHVALEAAARCIVLLRNDVLPTRSDIGEVQAGEGLPLLPLAHGMKLAVIGEFAVNPRFQAAGASQVMSVLLDVPLDEIQLRAEEKVRFEPGFRVSGESDDELADRAVEAARDAEAAVVFCGLSGGDASAGGDRASLTLPLPQVELVQRIAAANPRTVVVLNTGVVVELGEWTSGVPALLTAPLLGEAGGAAIADVLFGEVNPSGRLAETIPLRPQDTATYFNFPGDRDQVLYAERLHVGYRWYNARQLEVAYPFGHGLSYTDFDYRDLRLRADATGVHADFSVRNIGTRVGREIPQLYLSAQASDYPRAGFEFKGNAVIELAPSEECRVRIDVPRTDLGVWDTEMHDWLVEDGDYDVAVGASSRDIRLSGTVRVSGRRRPRTLDPGSTLSDWLADPTVSRFLAVQLANLAAETGGPGASGEPEIASGRPGSGTLDARGLMGRAADLRLDQIPALVPELGLTQEGITQLLAMARDERAQASSTSESEQLPGRKGDGADQEREAGQDGEADQHSGPWQPGATTSEGVSHRPDAPKRAATD